MRRKDDRALRNWQDSIISDCGGLPEMDSFQLSMLDRATEAMIILSSISQYVCQEGVGIVGNDGQLTPCLRNSYIAYSNTFRLAMESIYARIGKKPSKVPDLEQYLREKYGKRK
jgi:hypothetical protein